MYISGTAMFLSNHPTMHQIKLLNICLLYIEVIHNTYVPHIYHNVSNFHSCQTPDRYACQRLRKSSGQENYTTEA